MEGGVALLLLVIIVLVGGGIALAMYLTGGAILFGSDREKHETGGERPEHKKVTARHLEHTDFGKREE